MDKVMLWGRAFPLAAIAVCIVAIVLIRKVLARSGPSSTLNWVMIFLFLAICASAGVAVWGFRHVKPPEMKGTWK